MRPHTHTVLQGPICHHFINSSDLSIIWFELESNISVIPLFESLYPQLSVYTSPVSTEAAVGI